MSHYTVLVIGENWEEQLEPYSENIEMDPPVLDNYLTPEKMFENLQGIVDKIKDPEYNTTADYYNWAVSMLDDIENTINVFNMSDYEFTIKDKKRLNVIKTYLREWEDKEDHLITEDGRALTTYNPNSKWDWYTAGGRWTGFFKLKEGAEGKIGEPGLMTPVPRPGHVDQCRICDIDIEGTRKAAYDEAVASYREGWEKYGSDDEKDVRFREFIYGINENDTEETYAQRAADSALQTFAVLKDGEWYERGKMGWWAVVTDEKDSDEWTKQYNELLDSLPEDTLVTVVDCHI